MTAYLLLFRGVGGKVHLPVKPLRDALENAGYTNVGTYINSGNAWLSTRQARGTMLAKVAALCKKEFGYERAIYAPTLAEWDALIANNPFPHFAEGKHLHASWLGSEPSPAAVEALNAHAVGDEAVQVIGNVAYLHTPHGFGTSKLAEKFDRGIGVPNTARNWNTVTKLQALVSAARA